MLTRSKSKTEKIVIRRRTLKNAIIEFGLLKDFYLTYKKNIELSISKTIFKDKFLFSYWYIYCDLTTKEEV